MNVLSGADSVHLFASVQRDLAGQYSLERELGRGGMAVVFLAREVELDRLVALKVLPPEKARQQAVRERFLREARMAASLSHPNIVSIHRVGEIGETVYFSMTFIDGGTLGERLRSRGPLSPTAATRMLREIAQALAYAHSRGIVHRDVKPDNILLDGQSGRALVSDFGIASVVETAAAASDEAMGTPHFMSPEQIAGQSVDARSDLYSLGVVGFLSLSGRLPGPPTLDTPAAAESLSSTATVVSLAAVAPGSPRSLVGAIDRALAFVPSQRFQSAEAMADALETKSATRQELPAALQRWVEERDPWHTAYVMTTGATAFIALLELLAGRSASLLGATMFAVLPIIPAAIFQMRSARRLFREGYSSDDIRAALDQERPATVPRQLDAAATREPWFHMPLRLTAWSLTALLLYSTVRPFGWPQFNQLQHLLGDARIVQVVLSSIVPFSCLLSLPLLTALGIPLLPRRKHVSTRPISRWFWGTRLGKLAERLLTRGSRIAVPSTSFRATESVLGAAVMDLFHALPSIYRERIPELPAIIERLQRHAAHARSTLVHLEGATIAADAEVEAFRKRSRRELTDSVSALETIRLDLLRLLGGDADLRPTTTALHAARRIGDELDRLQDAQREVDLIVPPLGMDLRPHSPA